jgi:hypothetical protein
MHDVLVAVLDDPRWRRTSSGDGQVVDDRVEHGLHALVLERRAA